MPQHIHLELHLPDDELEARYRRARDPAERSRWHFLWLLARSLTAVAVAHVTGYSAYRIGQIARRYNRDGPDGVRDGGHCAGTAPPLLGEDRVRSSAGPWWGLRPMATASLPRAVRAAACCTRAPSAATPPAGARG